MMKKLDVIIVGTGVAGLVSALRLAEAGKTVGVFTKSADPATTNTRYAQGGIIYSDDDLLTNDIFEASSKTSYPPTMDKIAKYSKALVEKYLLQEAQTVFNRDQGALKFTKEAAHSLARIIYCGDYTGKSIEESLVQLVKTKPNIHLFRDHTAIDLITLNHHGADQFAKYQPNQVLGVYFLHQEQVVKVLAPFTILATGGVGNLYLNTTNSEASRGDGHAMVKRAGGELLDMEFIQFHPTTLFLKNYNKQKMLKERRFLLTEAIRGEGGILRNAAGERFMEKYDDRLELASRDVVSRSIIAEITKTNTECVFLDISHQDSEWIKNRFPEIYEYCRSVGIDITKEAIPVIPAAHYTCGGVKTDLDGKTSLPNLYAIGEVACTGLHGANRLASTSLLEGLSFGHFAAEDILSQPLPQTFAVKDWVLSTEQFESDFIEQDMFAVKSTLWNYVGVVRTQRNLKRARTILANLQEDIEDFYKQAKLTDELIGLRNAVEIGLVIIEQSLKNNQSVGCFYKV
jgi:L-aspartate oxidase